MDWDLWGPSYVQDVMEEDALNEKSCVQVLRVLIAKADTEIEELEKDLVILRSELAWAESREWSEICSTSLREKINCLDISIQSLKNENELDINVHLPMNRKPAERIHEIIKVLLRRHCLEKDEQAGSFTIENSSTDTTNIGSRCSTENKKVSNFCLKIVKEEVQHGSTSAPDIVILESSLKPKANSGEVDEKVEPPSTVVEDLSLDAREHSTNNCDEKLSNSYTNNDSAPIDEYKILISSLKSGGKRRNYQKVIKKQPTNIIVKNSSSDVARCEIGLNRKKKSHVSISRSDVFVQTDSAGADAKPKISNYPLKTVQGKIVKRSKLGASNKVNSVKSSFMPDKKSMTVQEAGISNDKRSAINSLPNLQDQTGNDTTKPQADEEGTSEADKIQPAKTPANDQDSILCLSPKLSKPKVKRKLESNQMSIQDAGLSPSGSGFRSSSPSEIKRRPKFGISKDNAYLKQSLDVKILKSLVLQNNRKGDELRLTPEHNGNSVLLPDKRKMSLKLRIPMEIEDSSTHNKLLKLNADTTGGAGKEDLFIINSCCIGDSHELPCPTLRLRSLGKMKLVDLRAIAKKHNMRKYHKLKKEALVQAIADQQG